MSSIKEKTISAPLHQQKNADVSHNIIKPLRATRGTLCAEIEVGPHDDPFMSLGTFKKEDQPKGFFVEITPTAEQAELVEAEITTHPIADKLEFLLHIANNSNRTLCAEIRQLS